MTSMARVVDYVLAFFFLLGAAVVVFPQVQIPIISQVVSGMGLLNFLFHEFGHIVFGIAGLFIGVLGGTVAQLILPAGVMASSVWRRNVYGFTFGGFWVGMNLVNIGIYMADARAKALTLFSPAGLFGEETLHDWEYLFGTLHLLWADQIIGAVVFILGVLLMLSAAGLLLARPYIGLKNG